MIDARRAWSIVGGLALAGLMSLTETSMAGLIVSAPMVLTVAERQLLEDNPALRDLSSDILVRVLDLIAAARSGKLQERGGLKPLDWTDTQLLDQNPVLREVMQSSPEASADLLQLLKTAAGGGKPRK